MEIAAVLVGVCGGFAVGRLAVLNAPVWALPWLVVSILLLSWFFISVMKSRFSVATTFGGVFLSGGMLALERLSGVALSPAVVFFWVFCLFREFGSKAVVEV